MNITIKLANIKNINYKSNIKKKIKKKKIINS